MRSGLSASPRDYTVHVTSVVFDLSSSEKRTRAAYFQSEYIWAYVCPAVFLSDCVNVIRGSSKCGLPQCSLDITELNKGNQSCTAKIHCVKTSFELMPLKTTFLCDLRNNNALLYSSCFLNQFCQLHRSDSLCSVAQFQRREMEPLAQFSPGTTKKKKEFHPFYFFSSIIHWRMIYLLLPLCFNVRIWKVSALP